MRASASCGVEWPNATKGGCAFSFRVRQCSLGLRWRESGPSELPAFLPVLRWDLFWCESELLELLRACLGRFLFFQIANSLSCFSWRDFLLSEPLTADWRPVARFSALRIVEHRFWPPLARFSTFRISLRGTSFGKIGIVPQRRLSADFCDSKLEIVPSQGGFRDSGSGSRESCRKKGGALEAATSAAWVGLLG